MISLNPNFKSYVQKRIEANKFMPYLGFEITEIEAGRISGELEFKSYHQQQNGYLHGGISSAILDIVEGFAAYSLVREGDLVFTVEAKISYLNRGMGTKYFAQGWVIKPGKRFHFCEGEIWYLDKSGEKIIVAKGSATMAVIPFEELNKAKQ
ncbi:MAG: PaaI family thioesterase [Chitinophagales bacterium]|nr:PaaI family thioesterase [Chitinophagales bacterium]